jgi:hypothetical protein
MMGEPAEKPLLTLSPNHQSHVASPLAIYDSDFQQAGCLSSPHHFLSPRTFEQLQADGAALPSAALLSAALGLSSGVLPSAGQLAAQLAAQQPLSARSSLGHSSYSSSLHSLKPPTPRDEADGVAALLGMSTSQPSSAKSHSSGHGSAGSNGIYPNAGSFVLEGSAAKVAAMVYDALGAASGANAPRLPAAAPPASAASKRQRLVSSPLVPSTEEPETTLDQWYEGAGVSARRKPSGLGNLLIAAPASSASGSSQSASRRARC